MATADPTVLVAPTADAVQVAGVEGRTPSQLFLLRFKQDKVAIASGIFIIFLVLLAFLAPLVSRALVGHGPNDQFQFATPGAPAMVDEFGIPKGPNRQFWFGADQIGRDVFVRTLYGFRTSLIVAIIATAIAMTIGVVLGVVAGFYGRWVDTLISRTIDIVLSLPLLLFAIGLAAACSVSEEGCLGGIIRPGLGLVVFIIALFSWTYIARIVRGLTLSIREKEFVEASRSLGSGSLRIIFRDVLPNLVAPIIIYSTLIIPSNILFEAYLSYLGLGVPQRIPSWGRMIADANDIFDVAWWLMFFPGLALLFTTLSFNLLGDGLRDAFDPRSGR